MNVDTASNPFGLDSDLLEIPSQSQLNFKHQMSMNPVISKQPSSLLPLDLDKNPFLEGIDQDMMNDDFNMED